MLKVVYGRSGSGKSEYLYNCMKQIDKNQKVFVIVPEQCNLSVEQKIFDFLKTNCLMNIEILTLSRMAYRIENEVGIVNKKLSKIGKEMLIYDLLTKQKNSLKFLGKSEKNVEIVSRLITELKKHNVSVNNLKSFQSDDKYTNLKVEDVVLLYEKYEERIASKYIDENDSLTNLANNLDSSNLIKDAYIFIDEFLGFTKQEYSIFENIIKQAKEVVVAVPTNNLKTNSLKEEDIFYFNKKYANNLIKIAKTNNVEIQEVSLEKTHRFKNEELIILEKNLSNTMLTKYASKTNNVSLFIANNPYSEVENVAKSIHNLVRKSGYQYNEIGIITEDLEKYAEDIKSIFFKYDIPVYIDNKKSLNQNILVKYVLAMLDIYSKNWSYDSIFNYLKVGLLDIEDEDIYNLENYCRKWGISGSKFYGKEFKYEELNSNQEKLENLRKQISEPLLEFKEKVEQNKSVSQITKELYNYLINNNVNSILDKKLREYNNIEVSNEYNSSYKLFINILEDLNLIFGDEKISFERFKNLLEVGLNSCEIGTIPATQDQIVCGDIERTRSNKIKVLFVLGINDGFFPKANDVEGFLNDKDRDILLNNGIELAKSSLDCLYEEQFNIYRTLSTPEEKLFLSYSASNKEGKAIRPSILIKRIKKIFPELYTDSDIINYQYALTTENATFEEALKIYRDYVDGKDIPEYWKCILRYYYKERYNSFKKAISGIYYTNKSEQVSLENIQRLYGNTLKTSVSRLENYRKCPFAFHLTYGLKLREKDELKIEMVDTGTFMHEVIDRFFKSIDEEGINVRDLDDNKIFEIVSNIIMELLSMSKYYRFSISAKFRLLTKRLEKVVYQSICYMVYCLKYSNFSCYGHEIEFGYNSEFKPIVLEKNGKKIEITGKIDRIDTAKISDKQYVRIIDYKSSSRDIDLNKVMAGLQIQLITYIDAICDQTDFEASGILYMGLIDNVVKNAKNMSNEQIEEKIRSNFKMKGLILADINVIKMMDNKLQTGQSDIIPVYIDKEGNISEKKSKVISENDFKELQEKVKDIIKEISDEILTGNIDIKPYYYNKKTGCDYCKFKTICMFNNSIKGNEYNYIKKI